MPDARGGGVAVGARKAAQGALGTHNTQRGTGVRVSHNVSSLPPALIRGE